MSPVSLDAHAPIPKSLIDDVCSRLASNRRVRQSLPGGGMLNIERQLPFLCVYRRDPARGDAGTECFVTAESSYLLAPGSAPVRKGLRQLVQGVAKTVAGQLGGFLLLEIWSADAVSDVAAAGTGELALSPPGFCILTRQPHSPEGTVASLEFALQRIRIHRLAAEVRVELEQRNHPRGLAQLIDAAQARRLNCHVLGLEVRPIYRDVRSGEVYEQSLRILRRGVARALKKAFFTFAMNRTRLRPHHYYSLGRSTLPQQLWNVDRQLAGVSGQFRFLLQVTPINAERAWREFSDGGFARQPDFQYRPPELDPLLLKRQLFRIGVERIDDPTLAHVMRQTQDELDRQITMLADVNTRRFLPGSLQVFGGVEPSLLKLAHDILRALPRTAGETEDGGETVTARSFARRAAREIRYYRSQSPTFSAQAVIRDDIYSGLLAVGGNLLIGRQTTVPAARVEALLQHEIGTHLVTYHNGGLQPLRLLQVGLAGYDGLQEGLAVLSEYLVGGLSRGRMRLLAARVVATAAMVGGADFVETYRLLRDEHGFEARATYTLTMRVYRAGGLTKDAVYLRGLAEILQYLGKGGDLEILFLGKMAADHIAIVRELLLRGVLRNSTLRPRFLEHPLAAPRLERLRQGATVLDLLPN